ncbi:hypothetical protein J2128_001546 [Methanomicrobium sp. W14]|uniref:hypothetical protein n=1 Tax=Methanomicrobium sp. W14 TaxID=2817839 RepID=UPI001AE3B86B|nr:hypothetical protein [Methanomicrobium sp. W14]MBP2133592.1 hypothetical protein [Methanomicrobium sp. W14]
MKISLKDEYILIKGKESFLVAALAGELFVLFIETSEKELCQTIEKDDIIAVSAPEGGDIMHAAVLIELVRKYRQPLVVLPKEHPGSKRLKMVVSAGQSIYTRCDIKRGTHPEQNVICASEELGDISLYSHGGGIEIEPQKKSHYEISLISPKDFFQV